MSCKTTTYVLERFVFSEVSRNTEQTGKGGLRKDPAVRKCFCQKGISTMFLSNRNKTAWFFVHKGILCRFFRNYVQFLQIKEFALIFVIAREFLRIKLISTISIRLQLRMAQRYIIRHCPSYSRKISPLWTHSQVWKVYG